MVRVFVRRVVWVGVCGQAGRAIRLVAGAAVDAVACGCDLCGDDFDGGAGGWAGAFSAGAIRDQRLSIVVAERSAGLARGVAVAEPAGASVCAGNLVFVRGGVAAAAQLVVAVAALLAGGSGDHGVGVCGGPGGSRRLAAGWGIWAAGSGVGVQSLGLAAAVLLGGGGGQCCGTCSSVTSVADVPLAVAWVLAGAVAGAGCLGAGGPQGIVGGLGR